MSKIRRYGDVLVLPGVARAAGPPAVFGIPLYELEHPLPERMDAPTALAGVRVGLAKNLRGAVEFLHGKQSPRWMPLVVSRA